MTTSVSDRSVPASALAATAADGPPPRGALLTIGGDPTVLLAQPAAPVFSVRCTVVADVVSTVRYARDRQLLLAPRAAGGGSDQLVLDLFARDAVAPRDPSAPAPGHVGSAAAAANRQHAARRRLIGPRTSPRWMAVGVLVALLAGVPWFLSTRPMATAQHQLARAPGQAESLRTAALPDFALDAPLTGRAAVLELVRRGLTNAEITQQLSIAEREVEAYLSTDGRRR